MLMMQAATVINSKVIRMGRIWQVLNKLILLALAGLALGHIPLLVTHTIIMRPDSLEQIPTLTLLNIMQ